MIKVNKDDELKKDENGIYRMDFEDMEKKIVSEKITMMIFCSPHNPTGRVWEKEEVESVVNLCAKHGVKLVSDEIWADFVVDPACHHTPHPVSERQGKRDNHIHVRSLQDIQPGRPCRFLFRNIQSAAER